MTVTAEEVSSFLTYNRDGDNMRIDDRIVTELIREAEDRIADLAETRLQYDSDARMNSSERAQISKELLFISHLLDKARLAVLDEYYRFKGETSHLIGGKRR